MVRNETDEPGGSEIMSVSDPGFLKNAGGVLTKDGRLLCLKCFREDLFPFQRRKGHLESRIGPIVEGSGLKDIGVIITQTDVEVDDLTHLCDKCGGEIK